MNTKVFEYEGNNIRQDENGFISLTDMCKANGKRLDVFMKTKKTKEYINSLENSHQTVVVYSNEGNVFGSGTWGHPSLAINLARWISSGFAVWCDAHIFNLMTTGSTSIDIDPIQEMQLKLELLKAEEKVAIAQTNLIDKRQAIVTMCPEPVQQKILGYQVVEKVEYRDRIIKDDEILHDGSTINKTNLCRRYGFINKNGNPDYRQLNKVLEGLALPSEAWELKVAFRENNEFKTEYLPLLDQRILNHENRQLWLGE